MELKLVNKESIKRKLYATFHRLGVSEYHHISHNIYIDDDGSLVVISPDGITDLMGTMSYSGEFVCNSTPDYLDN